MPKVTDAYREARRDEIAHAAMRCLSRQGFAKTSMADIIAESGLSAGAIYSHFASKTEIAHYVARLVITTRAEELLEFARTANPPASPAQIVGFIVRAMDSADIRRALLLQIWAEATVDPELHAMINRTVGQLRTAYGTAIEPWLLAHGRPADPAAVRAAAASMVALSQGYITNTALFGGNDPDAYFDGITRLLDPPQPDSP